MNLDHVRYDLEKERNAREDRLGFDCDEGIHFDRTKPTGDGLFEECLPEDVAREMGMAIRVAEKDTAIVRARLTLALAKIRELEIDPVTKLPTRAQAEQRALDAWERAGRAGTTVGVGLVDVDKFKLVNDGSGHAEGDRVLRIFARVLRGAVRAADFVGRWGGDEFIIICEAATRTNMLRGGQRILNDVRSFTPVTASIGFAIADAMTDNNTLDVLARADARLLTVKQRGRDDLSI
jgi:diguanylate cyclase (GGDEF)-like protein